MLPVIISKHILIYTSAASQKIYHFLRDVNYAQLLENHSSLKYSTALIIHI
jgi:hypothetical protein